MKKKNPVAKNLNKFNKPTTHKDRKKESKKNPKKDLDQLDLFVDNKGY